MRFAPTLSLLLVACSAGTRATAPAPDAVPPFTAGVVPDSFVVRLATSQGEVDAMIRRAWAPHGADRFYELVSVGFYDRARFFRTLRGFVTQFGLAADSATNAEWRGKRIPDDSVLQSNRRGTLVYAAGGPNTRTTQLFINLRDNARLDAMGFAPIGEVVRGIEAVDAFYTGYGDGPQGPQQDSIARGGERYLAANFPRLDRIETARVVRAWFPPAAAASQSDR
ncbi:MAG: peptidylprolyl isomerase [Gemmatimonadaceae bacterium]|nr:peptidylprolyl isomerase [Gemmatimonadaceae bacterium]MCW5826296.1 peptidylprolyl isomerase [Gemmatimonadaceae bacterium]